MSLLLFWSYVQRFSVPSKWYRHELHWYCVASVSPTALHLDRWFTIVQFCSNSQCCISKYKRIPIPSPWDSHYQTVCSILHIKIYYKPHIYWSHLELFSILKYNLYSKETEGQGMFPFVNWKNKKLKNIHNEKRDITISIRAT